MEGIAPRAQTMHRTPQTAGLVFEPAYTTPQRNAVPCCLPTFSCGPGWSRACRCTSQWWDLHKRVHKGS